jgi:hypothetical protein
VWAFRHYGDVDEQMVSLLRESLDGTALPDDLRSRLMSTLANELAYGDPALRDEASRGGMTLAPRVGDPDLRAFSLTARHLVLEATPWSETEEMRGIGQELLRIAQQGKQPGLSQQAEFVLSMAALRAFDVAEADTHVAIAAELVRRQRPSIMTRRLVVWSCARQVLAGDFVAALELLEELQTQQGMWGSSSFFSTLRAMQLVSADRASDLGGHLDAVREFHPAMANDLRILHLHAMGEHDVAAKLACAPGRPLIPSDWVAPTALVVRGLAMAACGPSDRRSQAYAQLIAGAGQIAATGSIDGGPVDWVLGQLAASQGDLWTAVEHWSRLEGLSTAAGLENWARKASWQLTTQVNQRLQAPVPE